MMKAGDGVVDSITGEHWTLAFYDPARDEASWCGWPEGLVREASKRLRVVRPCTDEESREMLWTWAERTDGDLRTRAARELLKDDPREKLRRRRELMDRVDALREQLVGIAAGLEATDAQVGGHFVRVAAEQLGLARERQPA